MKRWMLLIVTTALLCGGALAGSAMAGGPGGPLGVVKMLLELDLSLEQKREIAALLEKERARTQADEKQGHAAAEALAAALTSETATEAELRQAAEKMALHMSKVVVDKTLSLAEIKKKLTPEQLAKVRRTLPEMFEHMRERRVDHQEILDLWIAANK